jgi:HAAS
MIAPGAGGPAGEPAVERYLAEITARLPGPPRRHASLAAELRSGLLDAVDAYRAAGLPPGQAVAAAIGEFGDPAEVAGSFRAEVAAGQARRTAAALLASGPLVGVLWFAVAVGSHLTVRAAPPWRWPGMPASLSVGLPLVAVAVAITAWAAITSIAATGRFTRWLPPRPRRAPTAAAVAGFGAVSADGLGLLLLGYQLATGPGALAPVPAAAAAAASVARLVLAGRAAHRCLAIRTSLI